MILVKKQTFFYFLVSLNIKVLYNELDFPACSSFSTDLLKAENNRDFLLGTGSDQIVRKQLTGRQELVITALINQNIKLRTGIWFSQYSSIVQLWRWQEDNEDQRIPDVRQCGVVKKTFRNQILYTAIHLQFEVGKIFERSLLLTKTAFILS